MLDTRTSLTCAQRHRVSSAALATALAGTCISAMAAGPAHAASTSVRLRAYVPVFCALKPVAPYSNVLGRRGGWGPGKFKVVCNTPYHMHMGGTWGGPWDPPGWPHFGGHHKDGHKDAHKGKDMDVELRITGQGRDKQALCAFSAGREMSCRSLADDDGAGPPRQAQAQVTIGRPSFAGGDERPRAADGRGFGGFDEPGRGSRWDGRMSLGGLPRVASAGELPYLPSIFAQTAEQSASDGLDDDFGLANDDDQVTLFLTLTGRY